MTGCRNGFADGLPSCLVSPSLGLAAHCSLLTAYLWVVWVLSSYSRCLGYCAWLVSPFRIATCSYSLTSSPYLSRAIPTRQNLPLSLNDAWVSSLSIADVDVLRPIFRIWFGIVS